MWWHCDSLNRTALWLWKPLHCDSMNATALVTPWMWLQCNFMNATALWLHEYNCIVTQWMPLYCDRLITTWMRLHCDCTMTPWIQLDFDSMNATALWLTTCTVTPWMRLHCDSMNVTALWLHECYCTSTPWMRLDCDPINATALWLHECDCTATPWIRLRLYYDPMNTTELWLWKPLHCDSMNETDFPSFRPLHVSLLFGLPLWGRGGFSQHAARPAEGLNFTNGLFKMLSTFYIAIRKDASYSIWCQIPILVANRWLKQLFKETMIILLMLLFFLPRYEKESRGFGDYTGMNNPEERRILN